MTVFAPEASEPVQKAWKEGKLSYSQEAYVPDSIPEDAFMVLAATDSAEVNEAIWQECRKKKNSGKCLQQQRTL